jgi:hypothetical protein
MMSSPAALSAFAFASIASVADGATDETRRETRDFTGAPALGRAEVPLCSAM